MKFVASFLVLVCGVQCRMITYNELSLGTVREKREVDLQQVEDTSNSIASEMQSDDVNNDKVVDKRDVDAGDTSENAVTEPAGFVGTMIDGFGSFLEMMMNIVTSLMETGSSFTKTGGELIGHVSERSGPVIDTAQDIAKTIMGVVDTKVRLGKTIGDAFNDHGAEVMDIGRSTAGKTIGLVQAKIELFRSLLCTLACPIHPTKEAKQQCEERFCLATEKSSSTESEESDS